MTNAYVKYIKDLIMAPKGSHIVISVSVHHKFLFSDG